jgi:hypothetical protein
MRWYGVARLMRRMRAALMISNRKRGKGRWAHDLKPGRQELADGSVRFGETFVQSRGLSILTAACLSKISGKTSRAFRAREKISFTQTRFSRSARSRLRLRFIPSHLTFVGLAKTDNVRLPNRGVNTITCSPRCQLRHSAVLSRLNLSNAIENLSTDSALRASHRFPVVSCTEYLRGCSPLRC